GHGWKTLCARGPARLLRKPAKALLSRAGAAKSRMDETTNIPQKIPVSIQDELRTSYLDYAMSVIIGRAIPDVRDGLKPVHRRILFSMNEQKIGPGGAHKKCARVVGDVLGKYHPHGDLAVYDALVRMGPAFTPESPPQRGAGKLRLGRRRPTRRDAVHRGAPVADRGRGPRRPRQRDRRFRTELRRLGARAERPAGEVPSAARERFRR